MEATPKAPQASPEDVLREYPAIGKYRIRVLKKGERPPQLDLREYVTSEKFEGFTRRGVRLTGPAELAQLMTVLRDALQVVSTSTEPSIRP